MRWLQDTLGRLRAGSAPALVPAPEATAVDWRGQGNAALQKGDLTEAARCYAQGVASAPRDAQLRLNLGFVLLEQGHHAEAAERLRQALALRSPHEDIAADAHYLLGRSQRALGCTDEALASFAAALRSRPGFVEPVEEAVQVCEAQARHAELAEWARSLLALRPSTAARLQLASGLAGSQHLEEALEVLDTVRAQEPRHRQAAALHFDVLFRLRRFEAALEQIREMLTLYGPDAGLLAATSATLEKLDRREEALAAADQALALEGNRYEAWMNRVGALIALRRLPDAIAAAREALRWHPEDADLHMNLGFALLMTGAFAEGWREHEWRLQRPGAIPEAARGLPVWRGESLEGQRIFLYAEQGFGDSIQCLRYVPQVAQRAGEVFLQVPPGLHSLVGDVAEGCRLLPPVAAMPEVDFVCPLLSLPAAFRTDAQSVPAQVPYLRAQPDRVAVWRERVGTGKLKVGIAWQGNPNHGNDRHRSLPLATLRRIGTPACAFFSVQPGLNAVDRQLLADWPQADDAGARLGDFADTAALLEALDLVVCVDTSVAHLAGALGRPVWILLPWVPDWRWRLDTDRSAWYPTARLYRQPAEGDWASVVDSVHKDLVALAAGQGD